MRQALTPLSRISVVALLGVASAACDGGRDHPMSSTTQLVMYPSCDALEVDLKALLIEEADAMIDQWGQRSPGGVADAPESPTSAGDGNDRQEGVDYSGTNNQEDGVDEADIVKTDGFHIYALNGNRLHIFGVPAFGQLTFESQIQIEGAPSQLLVDRDAAKAAVFSTVNVHALPDGHPLRVKLGYQGVGDGDPWYWRTYSVTKITVIDVADRTQPRLVRELYFEGWYSTAREIDGSVRMAAYSTMTVPALSRMWRYIERGRSEARSFVRREINKLSLHDLTPQLYVRTPDGTITTETLDKQTCTSFARPTDSHARGIASLISFDLFGDVLAFDSDHILANWPTFYASRDTIVLTEPAHDWWWYWTFEDDPEHLNVHAFDISKKGETSYLASGRVSGSLFDPFSIDEEAGAIRIATTSNWRNRWWLEDRPPTENHLFVLMRDGDSTTLETVGHLGPLAPGESIQSARLLGDKGYLVTAERIDPLFTIDLRDPRNPKLVGELKIPGFSTYLHPIADNKLLTIGVGGDDNGPSWQPQISLFDVGDFAKPTLSTTLPLQLEGGWTWTEAMWEHKAFQYWAPKQLLAIPQATYRAVGTTPQGWTDYRYISRLEVLTIDSAAGSIVRKGSIDHSSYYNSDPRQWSWSYVDIRRSIFMGDYIYAISDKAITVHRTSDLAQVDSELLPGTSPNDVYWWW